jgi:hypothetical protein
MYAPAGNGQPAKVRVTLSCWTYIPLVPILSLAVYIVGTILWTNGFRGAWDSTQKGLDAMGVVKIDILEVIRSGCISLVIALSVLMVFALVFSFWRCAIARAFLRSGSTSGSGSCAYMTFNGIITTMAWLATLLFVALLGGFLVWAFSAVVIEVSAKQVTLTGDQLANLRDNAANTIKIATSNIDDKLGKVAGDAVSRAIDSVTGLLGLGGNRSDPVMQPGQVQLACPSICINLSQYNWMQKNRSCICTTERLKAVSANANNVYHRLVPALAGMIVMFAAASWMTHALVAHFTRTGAEADFAERQQQQRSRLADNGFSQPGSTWPGDAEIGVAVLKPKVGQYQGQGYNDSDVRRP